MKAHNRKTPHFFIINPIKDRRIETRFDSREVVQLRFEDTGQLLKATARDVGQYGLKLESTSQFSEGDSVQVVFPSNTENIGCFGRIAWSRPSEAGNCFESGLAIDSWHGIVDGSHSWKKVKGAHPKIDRRQKDR